MAFKLFEIKNRVSLLITFQVETLSPKNGFNDNFRLNRKSGKKPGQQIRNFETSFLKVGLIHQASGFFFPERIFCQLARNLNPDKSGVSDRNEQICFGTENNLCSIMHSL